MFLMKLCAINLRGYPFFCFFELSGKDIGIKGSCQMLLVVLLVISKPQALPLLLVDKSRLLLFIANGSDKENL